MTADYTGSKFLGLTVETGVGYGLTAGSDKYTLKLMLSRNLNGPRNTTEAKKPGKP